MRKSVKIPGLWLLALLAATAAAQAAEPAEKTRFYGIDHFKQVDISITDACKDDCAKKAEAERAAQGPAPASPYFRRSATQSALIRKIDYVAKRALGTSEEVANLTTLEMDDILGRWPALDPKGSYRPDDLADVIAKYWLSCAFFFGVSEVTELIQAAVRAQMHRLLATTPTLTGMSEAQRQLLAERLIRLQFEFETSAGAASLMEDPEERRKLTVGLIDTVGATFKRQFGLDLETLALAPKEGFVQSAP